MAKAKKDFKAGMEPVMGEKVPLKEIFDGSLKPPVGFVDAASLGLPVPPPLAEDVLDGAIAFDGTPESVRNLLAAGFQVAQSEPCEVDIYVDGQLKGVAWKGDFVNTDGSIFRPNQKA